MQPLQIQGYSGQGTKRKTPTGDENPVVTKYANIFTKNKKKDPDRGRKLKNKVFNGSFYGEQKERPRQGTKTNLSAFNGATTGLKNKKKDPDRGRKH